MLIIEQLVWCFSGRTVEEFASAMGQSVKLNFGVRGVRRLLCEVHLSLLKSFSVTA